MSVGAHVLSHDIQYFLNDTLLDVPQFRLSLLFSDLPVELLGTAIVCKFLMLQVALC